MYGSGQPIGDLGSRRPLPFELGQVPQENMRAELVEIQKADLGRKYARVDRRPLDPPPVVLLKLYQVVDVGTDDEYEREIDNYDEIQILGVVCSVDLFPVPGNDQGERGPVGGGGSVDGRSSSSGSSTPPSAYSYTESDGRLGPKSLPPSMLSSAMFAADPSKHDEPVHYVNSFPIWENTKTTGALVGATFIQPSLVEYQGRKALVFVFADLAVKTEGHFILRYRAFDIYSRPRGKPDEKVAMQAECYGGPFRVFSTKEFPGLQASTELTKHLARWGVRLNIRETERRRRKKGAETVNPPYTTVAMKRKWHPSNGDDEDGDASGDD